MQARWLALTLGGWLASSMGSAAAAQSPAVPPSPFGEEIDVRVVNVDVVVTDAHGRRVPALGRDDFRLRVDGKDTPIEFFQAIDYTAEPEVTSAATPQAAEPGEAAAPVPSPRGRSLLLFIDDAFSLQLQRNAVLSGLERDLERLGPNDRMAIVALDAGRRLEVLCPWTADHRVLAAALGAARARPANGIDALAMRRSLFDDRQLMATAQAAAGQADRDPLADKGAPSAVGIAAPPDAEALARRVYRPGSLFYGALEQSAPEDAVADLRVASQLEKVPPAVEAAMRSLAPAEGRPMLLLLSGGWPMPELLVPVAEEANRLGYTVYPVDVAGIDQAIAANDASVMGRASDDRLLTAWEGKTEEGLELVAALTGGEAFLNSARLDALSRALEDTSSHYRLGFTPRWSGDDRNHQIEVTSRRAGLRVRSRHGFSDASRRTAASLSVQDLLLLGGATADRRLELRLGAPEPRGRRVEREVTILVPLADLELVRQGDSWWQEGTMLVCVVDRDGARSETAVVPLRLRAPAQPGGDAMARFRTRLSVLPRSARLVAVLELRTSNRRLWGEADLGLPISRADHG